jgi:hypothetical protein
MEMMAGDELFDQIIEREQYPEDEASVLICQVLFFFLLEKKKPKKRTSNYLLDYDHFLIFSGAYCA